MEPNSELEKPVDARLKSIFGNSDPYYIEDDFFQYAQLLPKETTQRKKIKITPLYFTMAACGLMLMGMGIFTYLAKPNTNSLTTLQLKTKLEETEKSELQNYLLSQIENINEEDLFINTDVKNINVLNIDNQFNKSILNEEIYQLDEAEILELNI